MIQLSGGVHPSVPQADVDGDLEPLVGVPGCFPLVGQGFVGLLVPADDGLLLVHDPLVGLLDQQLQAAQYLRLGALVQAAEAAGVAFLPIDPGVVGQGADPDGDMGPGHGVAPVGEEDRPGGEALLVDVVQQLLPEAIRDALALVVLDEVALLHDLHGEALELLQSEPQGGKDLDKEVEPDVVLFLGR